MLLPGVVELPGTVTLFPEDDELPGTVTLFPGDDEFPGVVTLLPPGVVTPPFVTEEFPVTVPVVPGVEVPGVVTFVTEFPDEFPVGEEYTLPAEPPSMADASFWQTPSALKV